MDQKMFPYKSLINFAGLIMATIVTILLMIFGKAVIIPIVIAVVICFLLNGITNQVEQIVFFGVRIPRGVALTITVLLFIQGFLSLMRLSVTTVQEVLADSTLIIDNLNRLLNSLPGWVLSLLPEETLNQDSIYDIGNLISMAVEYVSTLMTTFLGQAASIAGQALVILFYVIFLLIEQRTFTEKIGKMFSDPERRKNVESVLASITLMIQKYVSVKTWVSIMVGTASWLVMWLFSLDNALFWAILIFLLNYIPYVGSIVAVTFPVLFSMAQFGNWTIFIALLSLLFLIQIVVGYMIEPMLTGRTLDISPFVVLVSLSIFGTIWGVTGMVLAVPIVIIMIIVFGHFETTRPMAILLSGNGNVSGFVPDEILDPPPITSIPTPTVAVD
ncbi:MAG: AI-2E family transporter [Chloroflexota bacterium]